MGRGPARLRRQPGRPDRPAPLIAIDGPAGAGKSTLARRLAEALGVPHIDSGVMYRALASAALTRRIDPRDGPGLASMAGTISFGLGGEDVPSVLVDGRSPDPSLRSSEVEEVVSAVASHPEVRGVMRAAQRALANGGGVVEGRDIGSVVLREAPVKIYLSAEPGVRAERRAGERGRRSGLPEELARRDALDERTSPPSQGGAHVLDSTDRTPDEVFQEALRIVEKALNSTVPGE